MARSPEAGPRKTWRYRTAEFFDKKSNLGILVGLGLIAGGAAAAGPVGAAVAGFGEGVTLVEGVQKVGAVESKDHFERTGKKYKMERKGTIFSRVKEKLFPRSGTIYSRNAALAAA